MPALSDEHLVAACLRREGPAQQALYQRYGPYTLGICRRHTADMMEAEDTHQVGWLRTFDKLGQWKENGPLRAWLRRVFVSVCINAYQKRVRQNRWLESLPEDGELNLADTTPVEDFAERELLLKLIAALPETSRLVFNLYAIDGYSHAEIATELSITEGASRQILLRARTHLARQLRPAQNTETAVLNGHQHKTKTPDPHGQPG